MTTPGGVGIIIISGEKSTTESPRTQDPNSDAADADADAAPNGNKFAEREILLDYGSLGQNHRYFGRDRGEVKDGRSGRRRRGGGW